MVPRNYYSPKPTGLLKFNPKLNRNHYKYDNSTGIPYYTGNQEPEPVLAHWTNQNEFKLEYHKQNQVPVTGTLVSFEEYSRQIKATPRPSRASSPTQEEGEEPEEDRTVRIPIQVGTVPVAQAPQPSAPALSQTYSAVLQAPRPSVIPPVHQAPGLQSIPPATTIPLGTSIPTSTNQANPMATAPKGGPPIAKPNFFTGEDRRLTRQFIYECKLVLEGNAGLFTDDTDKMAFVKSYMKGPIAKGWAMDYTKKDDQGNFIKKQTIDDLLTNIGKDFKEVEQAAKATSTLEALRQGRHSVDAYNGAFNTIKEETGFNEAALISQYVKGLKPSIALELLKSENVPTTLANWQDRAARYEISQATYARKTGFSQYIYPDQVTRNPHQEEPISRTGRQEPPKSDWDMVVDEREILELAKLTKLTETERRQFMREGRCFKCKKLGHISYNCPTKKGTNKGKSKGNIRHREVQLEERITPEQLAELLLLTQAKPTKEQQDFE